MVDLPAAVVFARRFHAASVWCGRSELDPEATAGHFQALIENPNAYFHVTESGFIAGLVYDLPFAPATKIGEELYWYCEEKGAGKALREGFEAWARARGASFIQLSFQADERAPRIQALLERADYEPVTIVMRKAA